jgi:Protein of unknown function (DUF2559)
MKKNARAHTTKNAEAIYEESKMANFIASSSLEGIHISRPPQYLTLEQVRRQFKQR